MTVIREFPTRLNESLESVKNEVWLKTYRPGGWNIIQVVHHCADSHMNAYIRLKLALTEDKPVIKPYMENLWAELSDSSQVLPSVSQDILKGVHTRWICLLDSMKDGDWEKSYFHPETKKETKLWQMTALYAWHCEHHLAHIELAKKYT